jgi:hypothetical protein
LVRNDKKSAHGAGWLQDIEKIGSKRGVIVQSIKDVLQVGQAWIATEIWEGRNSKLAAVALRACMAVMIGSAAMLHTTPG